MPDQLQKAALSVAKGHAVKLATALTEAEMLGKIDWAKVLPTLIQIFQQLIPFILPLIADTTPTEQK
jgi:hypothetical protein